MTHCPWSDGTEWEGGEALGSGNNSIVSVVPSIHTLTSVMVPGKVMDLKWNIQPVEPEILTDIAKEKSLNSLASPIFISMNGKLLASKFNGSPENEGWLPSK